MALEGNVTIDELKDHFSKLGYDVKLTEDGIDIGGRAIIYINATTLPPNVTFSNSGEVYLASLEVLPDNIKFDNTGMVNLPSLKSSKQIYQGEEITLKTLNELTYIIYSEKKKDNYTLYKGKYFTGSKNEYYKTEYIIDDGQYIYCDTKLKNLIRGKYWVDGIFGDFGVFNFIKEEDF